MLTRADIAELAGSEHAVAVSIFLPTHRTGRDTRADPIRLRNLLADAEHRLLDSGHRRPDIDALLAPASALLEDRVFWEHHMEGLGVFLAPGEAAFSACRCRWMKRSRSARDFACARSCR